MLPTMIAEPEPDSDEADHAQTEIGGKLVDPRYPQANGNGRAPSTVQVSQSMQRPAVPPPPPVHNSATAPTAALRPLGGSGPQPQQMPNPTPQPMPVQMPPTFTPSGMPAMPPPGVLHGSAPQPVQSGPFEHIDPAALASPVGDGYPMVDWAAEAATPIRVVPPWMLALLFVGAIVVALGITMIIALIIR